MWSGNWQLKSLVDGGTAFEFGTTYFPKGVIRATCPGGEFFFGFENSPNKDEAAKFLLWWAQPETTQHYLESLGGSLLSPMSNLKVNYGKYTEYLAPMLSDLNATPEWVSVDLARPALNLLQNDILTELILSATGANLRNKRFSTSTGSATRYCGLLTKPNDECSTTGHHDKPDPRG